MPKPISAPSISNVIPKALFVKATYAEKVKISPCSAVAKGKAGMPSKESYHTFDDKSFNMKTVNYPA